MVVIQRKHYVAFRDVLRGRCFEANPEEYYMKVSEVSLGVCVRKSKDSDEMINSVNAVNLISGELVYFNPEDRVEERETAEVVIE